MATVERLLTGEWLARVNIAFHDSLHREAVAASKGQACYWVHRWAVREAHRIYEIRPRTCTISEAMGPAVPTKKSEAVSMDRTLSVSPIRPPRGFHEPQAQAVTQRTLGMDS
jgi:hypothetical protein